MELYQKLVIGLLIVVSFYLFLNRKNNNFSKEYVELVNSDKYKVKKSY